MENKKLESGFTLRIAFSLLLSLVLLPVAAQTIKVTGVVRERNHYWYYYRYGRTVLY